MSSPGADPTAELEELAISTNKRLVQIAMGEGQRQEALAALKSALMTGDWLCLKNLHLVTKWLPELDKALALAFEAQRGDSDSDGDGDFNGFRLWLTAEPHNSFATSLLQRCIKVTVESPPGLKR